MHNYKLNFLHITFFLTTFVSFFGPAFLTLDLGFLTLFPSRVFVAIFWILILFSIIYNHGRISLSKIQIKEYFLYFIFWFYFASASALWAIDKIASFNNIIYLFNGISLIFFTVYICNNLKKLKSLYYVWLFALLIVVLIGFWTYITGNHLKVSRLSQMEINSNRVTSIFRNENDLATYLTLGVFFVVSLMRYTQRYLVRIISFVFLLFIIYLIIITFSRANFIGLIVGIFILMIFSKIKSKIMIISIFIMFLVTVSFVANSFFEELYQTVLFGLTSINETNESIATRSNLIKNSIYFTINTYGFGVGAGNAEYYMANYPKFFVGDIINVHNWWAEVLVNYGLIIFLGQIILYATVLIKLIKIYLVSTNNEEKMISEALLCGLVSFTISSTSPSSIMGLNFHWLFLGFVLAFINYINLSRVNRDYKKVNNKSLYC